jgi:hypothetical protein
MKTVTVNLSSSARNGRIAAFSLVCNLELLPINQHFLPNCKLPAVVLILNLSVELTGEPLVQNGCGWHKEGKVTLRVHKIPELVLNNHEEWVQAVSISVPNVICDPRLSFD